MNSIKREKLPGTAIFINLTAIFICAIFLTSCQHSLRKLIPQKTIITGQVSGHEYTQGNNTISIFWVDMISGGNKKIIEFDTSGKFQWETEIAHKQVIRLFYKDFYDLRLSPGDSIHVVIDGNILNNTEFSWENFYTAITVTGTSEELNKEMIRFMTFYHEEILDKEMDLRLQARLDGYQYTIAINDQLKKHNEALEKYVLEHTHSKAFKEWAKRKIKFKSWLNLSSYPMYHSVANGIPPKVFHDSIPENYYDFVDISNTDQLIVLDNYEYLAFLDDYFAEVVFFGVSEDTLMKIKKDKINVGHKIFDAHMHQVLKHKDGMIKDILIAKTIDSRLQQNNYEYLQYTDYTNLIENSYIKSRITAEVNQLKKRYEESLRDGFPTISEKDTHDNLLQSIKTKHQDKILYIHIWSPSCAPCLIQVPHSNTIKAELTANNVEFIFLANGCDEDSWQKAIEAHNIQGDHYRLTKVQYGELSELYEIKSIPHYLLVDKEGRIIDSDAPRPSNMEALKNTLKTIM